VRSTNHGQIVQFVSRETLEADIRAARRAEISDARQVARRERESASQSAGGAGQPFRILGVEDRRKSESNPEEVRSIVDNFWFATVFTITVVSSLASFWLTMVHEQEAE
jgi:hypothetical protein